MNQYYPIYTEVTECQDCYKCIRHCPVKAIRVENSHAKIIPELCVFCGDCVIDCPSHAKHIRDDIAKAKHLLSQKKKVYVSLAPSFTSEFTDYTKEQLIAAIKNLGFYAVSETALGADLVSAQLAEDLQKAQKDAQGQKLFLSSACPAVVEYIKYYQPELAHCITDRASPLLAHARYLKKIYGNDIGIVFIGPCIAKKREADTWDEVDVSLTYQELRKWFKAYNNFSGIRSMVVSGMEEVRHALEGFDITALKKPLFIELLACAGGCINGPGTTNKDSGTYRRLLVENYAETADEVLDSETLNNKPALEGTLPGEAHKRPPYREEEIKNALRSVGKYTVADELNCASCGYDTCREFAEAILENRAEKTMCVSYMRKLAQKKANGLIKAIPNGVVIVDKDLKIVECNKNFAKLMGQDAVDMYEAKPGLEGADLTKFSKISQFFSDVLRANGPTIIEKDVREGKKILHISIFEIEKEEIAAGVIEDVTVPQNQKKRTVSQAQKIIDKNLSVVQKIAFLLGENAAETESMLNSIIDSYGDDEEDR